MAQDTTPAMVIYTGVYDSETQTYQTSFEAPFDKGSYGEIKVAFVRRGLTDYTYDPDTYTTEVIDDHVWIHWTGDDITTEDIICIARETQDGQPYTYPNNQKHIENALDNLSRQLQEVAKKAQNALVVDPSWMSIDEGGTGDTNKMDPIAWLQTIVRSKGKTLRELRVEDGYAMFTSDDPESDVKTWNVLAGVKTGNAGVVSHIRETKVLAEDGETYIPYLEYSVDGGNTWSPAGRSASEIEHLFVKKSGDTMTGRLRFERTGSSAAGAIDAAPGKGIQFGAPDGNGIWHTIGGFVNAGCFPYSNFVQNLGYQGYSWKTVYARFLNNNGFDITIPQTSQAETLALKSEVNAAANSGIQLYDTGVWYAKMHSETTVPASAEVEGRNYADFSQVDQDDRPIIVIYEYTDGAWVLEDTITPPTNYNGYITVTSKIWDIPEQSGQQGGQILWAYNTERFTPYPRIVSFSGITVTGESTVEMPVSPVNGQITNKQYVDSMIANAIATLDTPELFDIKWKDCTTSRPGWRMSSGNWIAKADGKDAYDHLVADIEDKELFTDTIGTISINYYQADDGHKICPATEATNVAALLEAEGVAWYYILDTDNEQFKLPQTKYAFVGSRGNVGAYVRESLPNITGGFRADNANVGLSVSGAFQGTRNNGQHAWEGKGPYTNFTFDASRSSSAYQDGAPVQQRATQMYLYFYVGVSE